MSLKSSLHQLIKDRNGQIFTLSELEVYCKQAGYKLSNSERRLRASESPNIQSVYDEKHHHIIGYKWKFTELDTTFDWTRPTIKPKVATLF